METRPRNRGGKEQIQFSRKKTASVRIEREDSRTGRKKDIQFGFNAYKFQWRGA